MTEGTQLIRGLEGVVAAETTLCDLDGKNGRLAYCGYDIDELARRASFEEVCYLLWHGELPKPADLDRVTLELIAARAIPAELIQAFALMPKDTDPMRVLQAAVAILGMHDPDATDNSRAANRRKAARLTSQIATAICAHHRVRSGQKPVEPSRDLSHVANFLYMLTGQKPSAVTTRAMEASFTLYAEHELNASTFTTRVIAATLSDMHSAVAGGVGALKGTLHGGAGEAVMRTLLEIGRVDQVDAFTDKALAREAPAHGLRPSRLHRRRSAPGRAEGAGGGGVRGDRPAPLVRHRGQAPRARPGGEEADPQRRLLLGAALLLDRHPRRSLHAGDRGGAHRGLDGESPRAIRRQSPHPPARRLQGRPAPRRSRRWTSAEPWRQSLTQKLIERHLVSGKPVAGEEIAVDVDQVLLTDTNGAMAWLQFEAMGAPRVTPSCVVSYIDHNVYAVDSRNSDDHRYMETASKRYGAWFSKPGNGICHQVHFESFSVPGQVVLGTDSHTPLCGSTGMLAIGAGGLDVAVAMGGGPYHLAMPRVVRVTLTGQLRPWVSAKDVILELLRRYTVRGGSGKIFEYAGPGAAAALAAPARDDLQHGRGADAHDQRVPVGRGDARVLPAPRARGRLAADRRRSRRRVRRGDRGRSRIARAPGRAARLARPRRAGQRGRGHAHRAGRGGLAARTARGRTCGR